MFWQIEGANRLTGEEQTVFVEATTELEAMRSPAAATLFVTLCCPVAGKPPPAKPAAVGKAGPSSLPAYATIVSGSRLLHLFGSLCLLGGFLAVLLALFLFFRVAVELPKSREPHEGYLQNGMLASAITTLAGGVAAIILSVGLQWIAGLGLALRDIAQNSFRQLEAAKKAAEQGRENPYARQPAFEPRDDSVDLERADAEQGAPA